MTSVLGPGTVSAHLLTEMEAFSFSYGLTEFPLPIIQIGVKVGFTFFTGPEGGLARAFRTDLGLSYGISAFPLPVGGAVELERQQMGPDSFHVELQIDDSVVVLETGEPRPADATVASIYVYVADVDAAYGRALELGAVSIAAPEDKPYDERAAGVKDSFGNIWWISTYKRSGNS